MTEKTVTQIKTRLSDKPEHKNATITSLTLDWTGATVEMLKPIVTDGLAILLQGRFRRNKAIPPTFEAKVADLVAGMGSRQIPATVEGLAAVASTMKPEEVEALIQKMRDEAKARTAADKAPVGKVNKGKVAPQQPAAQQ